MCIINAPFAINDYNMINELESQFRLSIVIVTNNNFTSSKAFEFQNILSKLGINVICKPLENLKIPCSYSVFKNIFGIKLYLYQKNNKKFYSNSIRYDLNEYNYIDDILGLNNIPLCSENITSDSFERFSKEAISKDSIKFTPLTLAPLYNFPLSNGRNQTIGIIAIGGGYRINEINYYFKYLKLTTTPKIINVYIDGATNNYDGTVNSVEIVLNIEICGAIANYSTLVVYFAPNTTKGFYNALYAAINDNVNKPNIISVSWSGMSENIWSSENLTSFDNLFASAVSKGINIFCAAGDKGSNNGSTVPNINFPASSPNVIACGGTRVESTGYSIKEETVWNNFPTDVNTKSATSGGISKIFNKPSYQNKVQMNINYRCVPDISANADPKTGYLIFVNGGFGIIGGTRCVVPMMAALTALINESKGKNIGFINNKIYDTNVCMPIKRGNNGAYKANTDGSYSLTCGLGRINGKVAAKNL